MKSLYNAFWRSIVVPFILILVALICASMYKKHKDKAASENVSAILLRASIADSTRTATLELKNAEIDSLKAHEAIKTEKATANAAYWEGIANKRGISATKYRNKADSLAALDTGQCKEIIDAFRQANDSLQSKNTALDSANVSVHVEAESYSRRLYLSEKQCLNKDSIITSHNKAMTVYKDNISTLQCYRDWGLKHKFWKWVFRWKCD